MSTLIKSFWEIHPEVRDLAARLDAQGLNYADIQAAVREQCGDELVPSRGQIYSLRRGLVSGRWTIPADEPAVIPIGKKPARLHFWDRHPDVRDAALCMLPYENEFIISELRSRFPGLHPDTRKQLTTLRYGVLTGRWTVPERPILPKKASQKAKIEPNPAPRADEPSEVPEKAVKLLNEQWVGCRIRGVTCLSGRACLTRQLSAVKRHTVRTWRIDQAHACLYPGFRVCAECPHWLSDEELQATSLVMHGQGPPRRADNAERIL